MHLRDSEGGGSYEARPDNRPPANGTEYPSWTSTSKDPLSPDSSAQPGASAASAALPPTPPLDLIDEIDLRQIWAWNRELPPLLRTGVHELISARAREQPSAPAVISWDGRLSYRDVDSYSTILAWKLREAGLKQGSVVPLCFEKSRWTVVGVMAIMKAGGTFSLTDPSQPEGRLRTIVEQTKAEFIMTSEIQRELGRLIAPNAHHFVVSQSMFEVDIDPASLPELPPVPPEVAMYVIFTSGSTGRPKGVVISHQSFTSGAVPRADAVGYRAHSRVFDFASYAFDVSIDCMLCTLANGGCLCVPSDADRMNDLSGAIRKSGVNMAHMTPSVARVLDPDIIPSLEVLGLGGEAVSTSDAATWSKQAKVIIAYGPSECTVGCTINNQVDKSTNIGYGVGGTTWIVDPEDHNRLVPIGSVGELLVEGPVVGDGYLDEPEKTAEVFIEDPTWLVAGTKEVPGRHGRLYKTGDLVKYDSNGTGAIAFAGRKDQQVKLRGQRVELAEVEYHLRRIFSAATQVVAEVVKPAGGEPTLLAFVSGSKSTDPNKNGQLAEFSSDIEAALQNLDSTLGQDLPRYMVPSIFVPLEAMPALVSGKVDRKRLREIGATLSREQLARLRAARVRDEEPQTEMELALAAVWGKVLEPGVKFGLHDCFISLGGDSLRAMRLVSTAREAGILLTVAIVFQHTTLKEMAAHAVPLPDVDESETAPFSLLKDDWTEEAARTTVAELCGLTPEDIEDVYPCTALQEALMALSAKVKEAYVAQRVVDLEDDAMAAKLRAAFDRATMESPILRTRIVQVPGHGLLQVVTNKPLSWSEGDDVDEYLPRDRDDPMDLGKPLVRYALATRKATGRSCFVLTMHHALYDGWCMPLIVDRINRAYLGESPIATAPFKEFIKYLGVMDRSESETFWRETLEGAVGPQFPPLPYPSYQAKAGSLLELYVPLDRHPDSNVTLATVVRGAWAIVASQHTAWSDVVFGETLTGRNAPVVGAEEIEGPMITTVPVRVHVSHDLTIADYLEEIQAQTVRQIPHEHFGLQHIRRLSPDALEACELRTGLVLHPSTGDISTPTSDEYLPASRLVPAGDEEAAQEALKFNTYSLMLVCSLDTNGFFIMASFDSKTVDEPVMQRVLRQFGHVAQQLCESGTRLVGSVQCLTAQDQEEASRLSKCGLEALRNDYPDVQSVWIVDPNDPNRLLPPYAVGELVIETERENVNLQRIQRPSWLDSVSKAPGSAYSRNWYATTRLAAFKSDSTLSIRGLKTDKPVTALKRVRNRTARPVSTTSAKQRRLRTLWSRVLNLEEEEIGLDSSFFQLGGDSIAAMKLVSEARVVGSSLTVAKIFENRTLYDMANTLEDLEPSPAGPPKHSGFSLLDFADMQSFIQLYDSVRASLADPSWNVRDILPVRPLQKVAIQGTSALPRFSARYEIMYFDGVVDKDRLRKSCASLITRTEILRTVFVEKEHDEYLAVVLEDIHIPIQEYEIETDDVEGFAKLITAMDVQTKMPLGAPFVKWFFVEAPTQGRSALIFRISHAQYDEICLPLCLKQLGDLYNSPEETDGVGSAVADTVPFSSYVQHVVKKSVPESIPYWRELLAGSTPTVLPIPATPLTKRNHFAIHRAFDISSRSRDTTIATIPPAAWAFTLARKLGLRDVTFGEVVSGRNIDFPGGAHTVMGPCWQYIPVRVRFAERWTAGDLLAAVQAQHIAGAAHEAVGLSELLEHCVDWGSGTTWFDSVVHQDVEHVETMTFGGAISKFETVYPHQEPLREWKVQAFVSGDEMTVEVVTFESWQKEAEALLGEIGEALQVLLQDPDRVLFEE